MAEVQTFSFDNEDIRGGVFEKYKAKKGETHRCGIIYTDPKSMFAGGKIHYEPNAKRFFFCKKGLCCEKLSLAKWRVGAVIVKYGTDRSGQVKTPFSYEILPWVFSEQAYMKLKTANSEFALTTHDIKISCTNDEYQHIDINACNESIWTAKEELKKKILEEAKPVWDFVKKSIASDLSVEEIKDLLGAGSQQASDPTSNLNLESVLDSV